MNLRLLSYSEQCVVSSNIFQVAQVFCGLKDKLNK